MPTATQKKALKDGLISKKQYTNLNPALLDAIIKPGDMVITMGAGNIWRYSDKYNEHLKSIDRS